MADSEGETGDPASEINLMLSRPFTDDHADENEWLTLCPLRLASGRLGIISLALPMTSVSFCLIPYRVFRV